METIKKHKWIIHGCALGLLVALFLLVAIFFEDKFWVGNVLQTIGTIAGIYLTLIIFLHSKEESDKQFREHLEHLQKLNLNQIEALQNSTEKQLNTLQELNAKQIKTLHDLNAKQIEVLQDVTEKQITALFEITEKQIEALHKLTYEEISSFEKKISEVTNKLAENSILLAEILGRELEKSMEAFGNTIQREEARYNDLSKFKLLRTPAEREQQLSNQKNRIQQFKQWYDYIVSKYNQLKKNWGNDQQQLNG